MLTSMSARRTIKTLCLDGTLEGARLIDISDSLIKSFAVPPLHLRSIGQREEAKQPSLYFLLNADEVYVGECDNFYRRMRDHASSSDFKFCDLIVNIFAKDREYLDKAKVQYLESLAINQARKAGAMKLRNRNSPQRTINEFEASNLNKIFDDTAFVVQFLGFNPFISQPDAKETIWHSKVKATQAQGCFQGDNFVVLADSIIDSSCSEVWKKNYPDQYLRRKAALSQHPKHANGMVRLSRNIPFRSANEAIVFVLGRNANAWTSWKNAEGQTMDTIIRQE